MILKNHTVRDKKYVEKSSPTRKAMEHRDTQEAAENTKRNAERRTKEKTP